MLYDLDNSILSDHTKKYDFCIIGSGAAGITIANRLNNKFKVALVEAGGMDYTIQSQDCYKGRVIGDDYFELDIARLRYFGGTTNHWTGYCRTFDEIDFNRDYLGDEFIWPIKKETIDPFLEEASNILEIDIQKNNQKLGQDIEGINFNFSPPVRFAQKYKKTLSESMNIDLFVNANLCELIPDEKRNIKSAIFKSFGNKILNLDSKIFILCMGGIENSRVLLWNKEIHGLKFIDNNIPIGEYWMEHPHYTLGETILIDDIYSKRFIGISEKKQKELGIMNCVLRFEKQGIIGTKKLLNELLCKSPKLGAWAVGLFNKNLLCGTYIRAAWEQSPIKENKIKLNFNDLDFFNIPKSDLYWQKQSFDKKTLLSTLNEVNSWIMENDFGRIKLYDWVLTDHYPSDDEIGGYHHLGGTRMHSNKSLGVVDENLKVHGIENLYISGSSVFTTGGSCNPTLPIVQLSLRLSDYLNKLF